MALDNLKMRKLGHMNFFVRGYSKIFDPKLEKLRGLLSSPGYGSFEKFVDRRFRGRRDDAHSSPAHIPTS
jgi:hypothetical protein